MSDLTVRSFPIPTAELGAESPLPPIRSRPIPHISVSAKDLRITVLENMSRGHAPNILPYAMQDTYRRRYRSEEHPVAVLENQILRAEFLLDYGGRLWSLYHKPSQTELLANAPRITFANLALRNAWFCGGVEWNVGTIGHSPLTCSPVFAARLQDAHGTPILRLYEWERLRQVIVQIDACLPDDSPVLLLRPRVLNPGRRPVPMSWWSNVAVPMAPGMRVLAPADRMYVLGREGQGLYQSAVPCADGLDLTYPANWSHAADLFFDVAEGRRPWIAAISAQGDGLAHVSTDGLRGRKLWVWGTSQGGRNWQELLTSESGAYVEIQAGLTCTQLEHLSMDAGDQWSWMEAYGRVQTTQSVAHGTNWQEACAHLTDQIDRLIPASGLEVAYQEIGALADSLPETILHRGSGWGALERRRREKNGDRVFGSEGIVFDDQSLDDLQRPWVALLEDGTFPSTSTDIPPAGFLVGKDWLELLEGFSHQGGARQWDVWFHLGVMKLSAGDDVGAQTCWERSLGLGWSPWACRCLGALKWMQGDLHGAAYLMLAACKGAPAQFELLVECGRLLIEAGQHQRWLDLVDSLPTSLRGHGRIRLLQAQAALRAGKLAIVAAFLDERIVPEDLREGETSLSELWTAYHEHRVQEDSRSEPDVDLRGVARKQYPVPAELDFRIR